MPSGAAEQSAQPIDLLFFNGYIAAMNSENETSTHVSRSNGKSDAASVPDILLFQDSSQYDVLAGFSQSLGQGLAALGASVHYLDFRTTPPPRIYETILRIKPRYIVAFNAIGYDLEWQGQSLYDQCGITFVAWLVDHPMYHVPRLVQPMKNRRIVCVDPSHLRFIDRYFGGRETAYFIPHGAASLPADTLMPQAERLPEILFSGTYYDPQKTAARLQRLPAESASFVNGLLELVARREDVALTDAAWEILAACPLPPDQQLATYVDLLKIFVWLDQHHIAVRRRYLLDRLVEARLPLHLYGAHWEDSPYIHHPSVHIHPPLPANEMIARFARSAILLNMVPSFPSGSHERVFQALQADAVCATHAGVYMREHFEADAYLAYTWSDPESLIVGLRNLLRDADQRAALVEKARKKAPEHTWAARARALLTVLNDE